MQVTELHHQHGAPIQPLGTASPKQKTHRSATQRNESGQKKQECKRTHEPRSDSSSAGSSTLQHMLVAAVALDSSLAVRSFWSNIQTKVKVIEIQTHARPWSPRQEIGARSYLDEVVKQSVDAPHVLSRGRELQLPLRLASATESQANEALRSGEPGADISHRA